MPFNDDLWSLNSPKTVYLVRAKLGISKSTTLAELYARINDGLVLHFSCSWTVCWIIPVLEQCRIGQFDLKSPPAGFTRAIKCPRCSCIGMVVYIGKRQTFPDRWNQGGEFSKRLPPQWVSPLWIMKSWLRWRWGQFHGRWECRHYPGGCLLTILEELFSGSPRKGKRACLTVISRPLVEDVLPASVPVPDYNPYLSRESYERHGRHAGRGFSLRNTPAANCLVGPLLSTASPRTGRVRFLPFW